MRRFITVAATIGLVVGGAAVSSAAQGAPSRAPAVVDAEFTPAPIVWGGCADPVLQRRNAQCGFVEVPLDYRRPTKTKIKLAVSRIKHKTPDAQYQGIMLVNPGGPGSSGLILSVLGEFVPDSAGSAYDWIGFDPRGVGASVPSLACDGGYFSYNRPHYVPTSAKLEKTWLKRVKGYAKACDRAGGALLDHLKTTDTVADMESIRRALGEKQINFYGLSYGTYLGQVYATLHPEKVRRMVLDSNIDPRRVWYGANLDQDVAFDANIKVFFGWVAAHDDLYHLGTSGKAVEKLFYAEQAKFARKPAGGVIGPDEWTDIFLQPGYYVYGWQDVASAFSGWVNNGEWELLKELYDEVNPQGTGADNGYAVYLGVQCTDLTWPTAWSTWEKDNDRIYAKAPFQTWGNAWFNAPCRDWGAKPGTPVTVNGAKAPPILLIGETRDAATPFEGSLEVRSRFPKSVLVEGVGGTTHGSSLNGVLCTDNTISAYLSTGALPKRVSGRRSDRQCAPIPQPQPFGAGLRAAPGASAESLATRAELHRLLGVRR